MLQINRHCISGNSENKIVIIGAGPAGLTAAYELSKSGVASIILEKDYMVGGLSKTVNYKGFQFDIGGHRFFTRIAAVDQMWHKVLNGDFLHRNRLSRIYFKEKFLHYPLRPFDAFSSLGFWKSTLVLLSYLQASIFPQMPENTFERWVSNRFGKRLYEMFFKTFTEKVWGIPCSEISAEWAAQRIGGLSLLSAAKNSILGQKNHKKTKLIKTLIDTFDYPKRGPGMMWEAVSNIVQNNKHCRIRSHVEVEKVFLNQDAVYALEVKTNGSREFIEGSHFISSMPLGELIQKLEPAAPAEIQAAAKSLRYRDFLSVALLVDKRHVSPDNWIYIHDPGVKVGRIQNYKNWSPYILLSAHLKHEFFRI